MTPPTALVTPLLHPAAIVRGQWAKEPLQVRYLTRLKKAGFKPPLVDVSQPPPKSVLYPSLSDLTKLGHEIAELGAAAHDLETAGDHIICDGITAFSLETGEVGTNLCLRFRRQGGSRYWTKWSDQVAATRWLYNLLSNPANAKVFHNGVTFDVPILERLGFEVNGRLLDTMGMMHTCYPEVPKGLQFCGTFWLGMPCWKQLVDEDDEEGDGK